ncbi:caspase family protein [Polaribacter sp.]|uniref:caspase family protein n=1 Tax=Polaribacter sp. TaxID=1920175 RepID=UPI003EF481D6
MRVLIVFVCILLSIPGFAQDQYKLHLKDYHSTQITDVIVTKNEERIITIDNSGKILKYNSNDYSYHSTLKNSDGFFIETPRLIFDGKALVYKSKDSLWTVNSNGKVITKIPLKASLLNNRKNGPLIFTEKIDILSSAILIFDDNFKQINAFKTSDLVTAATISADTTKIAFVEEHYTGKQKLVCKNLKSNTLLWESEQKDSLKIIHPFIHQKTNIVYALTISEKENLLSIYSYKKGVRSKTPEITTPWHSLLFTTKVSDSFADHNTLIITSTSFLSDKPLRINFKNNKFTIQKIASKNNSYTAAYLQSKNEILFTNTFNDNFNDIATFSVIDALKLNRENIYPNFSQKFYNGLFLPDNGFLMYGLENQELKIKHFTKGTFYNRFHSLDFKNYLEVHHNVYFNSNYFFDKINGCLLFQGNTISLNERSIFKYQFKEDIITKIHNLKDSYSSIIDYDNHSNYLLLSPEKYYNTGHTKPQPLALVKNDETIPIPGLYKFAKFSNNAKHILTINEKNLVQIRTKSNTIIFEEQLKSGNYLLHQADDGFIISNSFFQSELGKCSKESIFFILKENNTFISENKPCIYINDLSYVNNKLAMIIEDIGVFMDNKKVPNSAFKKPKVISLNKDASKLMISYANGNTSIVDVTTFENLGGMFHASAKEHIFYSNNNHYFSNTNASDFLYATKDNKVISLEKADPVIFKPQEVLAIFGTPNQEYLTLLNKAIEIRKNKKEFNEIQPTQKIAASSAPNKKGDLYVVSIGVSEYEQAAYNLTFADKDAFDIANVYGKLDSLTKTNFNRKFLGENYTLQSSKNKNIGNLKKYQGMYTSIGKMYPFGSKTNLWLEIDDTNNTCFLWDYEAHKITEITFPKDFKKERISFYKQIYTSNSNNEFYLRTLNNDFYKFKVETNNFIKIDLPFDINFEQEANNLQPLLNNNWLHFSYNRKTLKNKIDISIGNSSTKKIATTTFYIDHYKEFGKPAIKEGNAYNPYFKDISKNGTFLLFNAGDDEAFVLNLEKDSIPIKIPIKLSHLEKASISEDGTKITVLSSNLNEFRYKTVTYNLKGEILDSNTFIDEKYAIKGISIKNASPNWILASKPLVDKIKYNINNNEIFSNANPFSFHKTYVKQLTNEAATKKNIEFEIAQFLKNTKKEDQIIIFLAGHGVLDKANNYYYAPYNMDFINVTKNGVSFKTLIEKLTVSKAENKLLLMDTCHAGNTLDLDSDSLESNTTNAPKNGERGSVTQSTQKKPRFKVSEIVGTLFDDFLSKSGVTILSASSGSDVAYENKELGNGAFTTAYLKILKQQFGYLYKEKDMQKEIILSDAFINKVLKEVILLTNGKQTPDIRELNTKTVIKVW